MLRTRTAEVTLLFGDVWVANVGQKSRVSGSAPGVGLAGFGKAQVAIHGKPDLVGVSVILSVIFPPANGAQRHCVRLF
jgi:hypothetical protein